MIVPAPEQYELLCRGRNKTLKNIGFQRIRAYNLVQVFEFIAVTFEMYYKHRLLAVAYNRMDRYIAIRYKGLGASKVNDEDMIKMILVRVSTMTITTK